MTQTFCIFFCCRVDAADGCLLWRPQQTSSRPWIWSNHFKGDNISSLQHTFVPRSPPTLTTHDECMENFDGDGKHLQFLCFLELDPLSIKKYIKIHPLLEVRRRRGEVQVGDATPQPLHKHPQSTRFFLCFSDEAQTYFSSPFCPSCCLSASSLQ